MAAELPEPIPVTLLCMLTLVALLVSFTLPSAEEEIQKLASKHQRDKNVGDPQKSKLEEL